MEKGISWERTSVNIQNLEKRNKNLNFLLFRQDDSLVNYFYKHGFTYSGDLKLLQNLGKFKILINEPRWLMEFTQNKEFLTIQKRYLVIT